jgi:hypothetical protein
MPNNFKEVNEVALVIGIALTKHYDGKVSVYLALGALSTIAADLIRRSPPEARAELLAAWEEAPAWVRASVTGQRH